MQSEETVQVDGCIGAAAARLGNCDGRTQIVIVAARRTGRLRSGRPWRRAETARPSSSCLAMRVAATARCKKDGREAMPSIAMPPFLMKYRREIFITLSPWNVYDPSAAETRARREQDLRSVLRSLALRDRRGCACKICGSFRRASSVFACCSRRPVASPGKFACIARQRRVGVGRRMLAEQGRSDRLRCQPFCRPRTSRRNSSDSAARRC